MTLPSYQAEPRMGIVTLSRGSDSLYQVIADVNAPYPDDATCAVVFMNTSGDVGATVPGSVVNSGTRSCIQFLIPKATADTIAAGYNFETFLYYSDGTTIKLRYGKVVRREATFQYPPSQASAAPALTYSDIFANKTGQPGNLYAILSGGVTIVDNSLFDAANALSLNIGALYAQGAVRIARASNTDSVSFSVQVKPGGAGITILGICANTNLTNYVGLKLDANINKSSIVVGSAPLTAAEVSSEVSDTVETNDVYLINYNNQTKTVRVYKNGSATPLLTWIDTSNRVVHGQGYRYPMFAFDSSLLSPGPQIIEWEYSDYAGT